jgi:hypothetical protein
VGVAEDGPQSTVRMARPERPHEARCGMARQDKCGIAAAVRYGARDSAVWRARQCGMAAVCVWPGVRLARCVV